MKTYIYQAAKYCHFCGSKLCAELPQPNGYDQYNESSYDSDEYPKGPYVDGGGESDIPEHCESCGVFLQNPLTQAGYRFVTEAINDFPNTGSQKFLQEWSGFYHGDNAELDAAIECGTLTTG